MTTETIELERRWVLPGLPEFPSGIQGHLTTIRQHYVPVNDLMARLRRSRDMFSGNTHYHLTFKQGSGLTRPEWEDQIPEWLYFAMRQQAVGALTKTRIKVSLSCAHVSSILFDIFTSEGLAGLSMIEVETIYRGDTDSPKFTAAKSRLNDFKLPSWVGEAREVTEDPRYHNQSLAINGRPEEPK